MRETTCRPGMFIVAGVLISAGMTVAVAAEITVQDLTGKEAPAGAVWLDTKDLSSVKLGYGTVGVGKACGGNNQTECHNMIPADLGAEIGNGKYTENAQCNDLLHDFQLHRRIGGAAPAIGGHHQAVFKKRDSPTHHHHQP